MGCKSDSASLATTGSAFVFLAITFLGLAVAAGTAIGFSTLGSS